MKASRKQRGCLISQKRVSGSRKSTDFWLVHHKVKLSTLASEKSAKPFIEIHPICRTEKQNWETFVRNLRKTFYIHFVRAGIPNPLNKITGCSVDTGACFLRGVGRRSRPYSLQWVKTNKQTNKQLQHVILYSEHNSMRNDWTPIL